MIPYDADYVVKVDPETGEMTNYAHSYGDHAFGGGVFDGTNIWMIPRCADYVVKVDPATGGMTNYAHSYGDHAFLGGVFDGANIWMIPFDADYVVRVNPATGGMTYYAHSYGSAAFGGGVFDGTNNRLRFIWMIPWSASYLVEVIRSGYDFRFGFSVDLIKNDNILIVGSPGRTDYQGGVYIYDKSGSTWAQRGSVITASDAADNDFFGEAVAATADGKTLYIGAIGWEGSASNQGCVYGFDWAMVFPFDGISSPTRKFLVGTSDWSNLVLKWPSIKTTINDFNGIKINIELCNIDKDFNNFYNTLYMIPQTATISISEGTSEYTVFTGEPYDIKYKDQKCTVYLRDKIGDLGRYKAISALGGATSFDNVNPALISWQLLMNYAGFDQTSSTANTDINFNSWLNWSEVFSRDAITMDAEYNDVSINDALEDIMNLTDSQAFVDTTGKMKFRANIDVSSNDYYLNDSYIKDVEINLKMSDMINRQWVNGGYIPASEYYSIITKIENTPSINSYGTFENTLKSENIWYTTSANCLYQGQRKVSHFKDPVKIFTLETGLIGVEMELGERIRFVDSFYDITSASAWRIVEKEINLDNGLMRFELSGALSLEPFTLDVSNLDGIEGLI